MRRQNDLVLLSCLYTEPFVLVFHYCTTPPCHKINPFKCTFRSSRFERLDDASKLLMSLIFLYPKKILISVWWPFELYDVQCSMVFVIDYAIRPLIPNTIFIKHFRVEIMAAFRFVLFQRDRFVNFCYIFCQQFSAAYLLKLFLLPQRVFATLFISCYKPVTRWCLCSLHAGIQMSPDEVVGSRDGCRHSIAEGTLDVPMRHGLFQSNSQCSHRVALVPFYKSAAYLWLPFAFCKLFGYWNNLCNCHHFSPFMSSRDAQVVQILHKNALLSFSVTWSLPSTCHMQGDWYCLALP